MKLNFSDPWNWSNRSLDISHRYQSHESKEKSNEKKRKKKIVILKPRGSKISGWKTESRVSYHVSLPQDVFLSKIPNVPLKKYPLHVSDASWILRPAHVCGGVKRGRQTLLRPMRTRQSAKSPRVKKERIVCAPRSRRFDQWRTTRRWFAASSTTRSSFSSSSSSYLDPPSLLFLLARWSIVRHHSSTVNLVATI